MVLPLILVPLRLRFGDRLGDRFALDFVFLCLDDVLFFSTGLGIHSPADSVHSDEISISR